MTCEDVRPFLERHHWGVVTTHWPDGGAQSSIVFCGAYQGRAAFVAVYGTSAKARNVRRDPRCTVMKPPRSKLRGITRKGIVCETPRFLTLFPLQGNLGASSEESPD